jgi:predicted DNA-binding transcriptional regulator YafY
MSKQQYIKRYNLIINKLRRNPCSFVEIQDFLQQQSEMDETNYELSIRTFQREIKEIEANYDIVIEYDNSQRVYKITHDGNEIRNERLMETFDIIDALKISNSLSNHLILEKRRPLGTNNMNLLIHAIKNNLEVNFKHQKFWDDAKKLRITQPLALKESRNRWYLIALDTKDRVIKTFGLDRISDLEITKKKFISLDNYNPDEVFLDSFGIISGEKEAQKIVLSFTSEQGKYIKSLPLHHSQKVVIDNEKEYRIELFIRPTYDFVMELLSIGAQVKVLEPESLKEEMKTKLLNALNLYN